MAATIPTHHHEEANIKKANRFPLGWIVVGLALLVLAIMLFWGLKPIAQHEPEIIVRPPASAPAK